MSAQEFTREAQIKHLYGLGVPKTKIAEQVGLHRNTVHLILQKQEGAAETTPKNPATQEEISQPGAQAKASVPAMPSEEAKEEMR